MVVVDVTVALFLADCLNVIFFQREQWVYFFIFFVYLAKHYLSSLRNLEAGWIDGVDLGSGLRQYQDSRWHLQLLILKSRRQGCEEAPFKKFCDSCCPHRHLVGLSPDRVSLRGDWWGRGKALKDTSSGWLRMRIYVRVKSRLCEQVQVGKSQRAHDHIIKHTGVIHCGSSVQREKSEYYIVSIILF